MAKVLGDKDKDKLLNIIEERYIQSLESRKLSTVKGWNEIESRLRRHWSKLWSLSQMETSGGEPRLISVDDQGKLLFIDCSEETPAGRHNVCYDREALESRKKHKPKTSCLDMCQEMGVELLSEYEYRDLQKIYDLDLRTSSWVKTPDKIRKLGGALFCDRRYDTVFLYHNGAESYYSTRGFRAKLEI